MYQRRKALVHVEIKIHTFNTVPERVWTIVYHPLLFIPLKNVHLSVEFH